jgi:hypothetical protein
MLEPSEHQRAARGPGQAAAEYRPSCSRQQEATHRVRAQRPGRLAGSTSHCATASRAARTHPGHPSPAAQPNPSHRAAAPPSPRPARTGPGFSPSCDRPVGEERQIIYSSAAGRQSARRLQPQPRAGPDHRRVLPAPRRSDLQPETDDPALAGNLPRAAGRGPLATLVPGCVPFSCRARRRAGRVMFSRFAPPRVRCGSQSCRRVRRAT